MNISHRDIKLENILVDMESENLETKIIDFGFSVQTKAPEKIRSFCGTPAYMAPELCLKTEYYGPGVDVWAIGVVFYTMLFGNQPWKGRSEQELFRKIT
jgi:serine/threonine protein kinase|tara:strand:- start:417 stop:713 length:297 start_codon:yes stop_codon:yes gene_type:complete